MKKFQNLWKHPLTSIAGILSAAVLVAAHQPNWHSFLEAIGIAALGALAKEK